MTAEFSFTNFLNSNSNYSASPSSRSSMRGASDSQKKFYLDLCERKRVRPSDVNAFTFDQISKEIEELQKRPDPASIRQIDKIKELVAELIELGADLKPMSETELAVLTGGRDGTASSLIESLFAMRTQLNEIAPATSAQIQIICEWFLCPAIPFEDFGIEKKVYLDKLSAYCSDSDNPEILEKRAWRLMTPTEFANQIKSKMTKRVASKFIDDYRAEFYEWRKTRVTKQQVEYIRELEKRLSNTHVPREVEWAIVDGELQQVTRPSTRMDYNPVAYTPLEDMQLAQMSYEQGSEWIDKLKGEVARKNSYKSMYNEESVFGENQQNFEDNRKATTQYDAKLKEYNALNDLIFSIEAILGYTNEEAHQIAGVIFKEGTAHKDADSFILSAEDKMFLKEFFMSTVTADPNKDEPRWRSEMARIFNMCEDIPVALEILAS